MFYDYWKAMIDKTYGSDYSVVAFSRGSGKTTILALTQLYGVYAIDTAIKLFNMKHIPRKMKKKYKEDKAIWNIYKSMRTSGGSQNF